MATCAGRAKRLDALKGELQAQSRFKPPSDARTTAVHPDDARSHASAGGVSLLIRIPSMEMSAMTKTSKPKPTKTPAKVQIAKARWAQIGRKKPLASQEVILCTRDQWDRIAEVREPLKRWSVLSFPDDMIVAVAPLEMANVTPADVKRLLAM
jgi:hypothetical protein